MPRDDRTYIRVDQGMPRHPKIVGLSDASFRTLLSLWCYCSEQFTDGTVPAAIAGNYRRRCLIELEKAGLLETHGGDWYCHDYLEHQRSASEVATVKAKRNSAGSLAAHSRWHTRRGRYEPDCPHCNPHT